MDPKLAKYRPAPFGLALFAYFLPFMTMTCMGGKQTLSGLQTAFGTTVNGQHMNGEPLAVFALVLLGVGLFLSLRRATRPVMKAEAGCAALAAILLIALQSKIQTAAARQQIGVSFEFGYWLTVTALAVACGLAMLAETEEQAKGDSSGPAPVRPT